MIEDVWKHYQTRHLQRWLEVHGYEKELKEVEQITSDNAFEIMDQLVRIFHIETDEEKIREGVYAMQYQAERRKNKLHRIVEGLGDNRCTFQSQQYIWLVQTILEKRDDMAAVKAAVQELHDFHMNIYQYDYKQLFSVLFHCAPMALFVMLAY